MANGFAQSGDSPGYMSTICIHLCLVFFSEKWLLERWDPLNVAANDRDRTVQLAFVDKWPAIPSMIVEYFPVPCSFPTYITSVI